MTTPNFLHLHNTVSVHLSPGPEGRRTRKLKPLLVRGAAMIWPGETDAAL